MRHESEPTFGHLQLQAHQDLSKVRPSFQALWCGLRHLARIHGILSAKNGFLSSYALTLMLITYLQTLGYAVLTRLQQQEPHRMVDNIVEGYDCTFDRNWSNHTSFGAANTQTVADLLVGFCEFFGKTYDYNRHEINLRLGTFPVRRGGRAGKALYVMDPFMTARNVASMVTAANVQRVQEAFEELYVSLTTGDISDAI